MSGLFQGLNIAWSTLKTQNMVLNITGHNIANANTPGYSRQTALLASISDEATRGIRSSKIFSVGEGVETKKIVRARFKLYDEIYRKVNQDLNDYKKTEELIHHLEVLFDEPSERGLSSVLDSFFTGWQEVANDPQSMAARQSLKSTAEELASRLHRIYNQLQTMREDINNEILTIPMRINEITSEIADLNISIRVSESQKAAANDLRDKRDALVDELSDIVDVRAVEQSDGTYTVIIGSKVVVERENQSELYALTRLAEGEDITKAVIISGEDIEYVPEFGMLGALVKFRDVTLKEVLNQLDVFTESLVNSVNYEHRYGFGLNGETEKNFFEPTKTKAFNIEVSRDIDDVMNIAASGDGSVGDNASALRIGEIKNSRVVDQRFTLSEYYNSLIADIGIKSREVRSGRMNEELMVNQIDSAREGIIGVSIDEELVKMIQTQRIYQSASRLVVVIDTLLEEILRFAS